MPESQARRLAEESAAGWGNLPPEMKQAFVEKAVTLLAHRDASARAVAAEQLGELARAPAGPPLERALDDPAAEVRSAAASALGKLHDPNAASPLLARLRDVSPLVRAAAATAIGRLNLVHLSDQADGNAPLGVQSVLASARESLEKALGDESVPVRRAAATSLGLLRQPLSAGPLGKVLATDTDIQVRAAAAAAMGQLLGKKGTVPGWTAPGTVPFFPADGNRSAGNNDALSTARESLEKALGDEAPLVRHAAVGALGAIGDRRAVHPLVARLKDRHAVVRSGAAFALGRLGDPAAAAALRDSTQTDPDSSVRAAAAEALRKLQPAQTGQAEKDG